MRSGSLHTVRALLPMAAALALSATPCWSDGLRVPLAIVEPVGVPRVAVPVTTGVSLPSGRVRAATALWVADDAGRALPTQTRVLERWPDGSARWALVDFLVSVPAHGRTTCTVRDGRQAARPKWPAVRLTNDDDGWRLDTGPVAVAVPRSGPALLRVLRPVDATIRTALAVDGAPLRTVATDAATVETAGPVRTELLLRGDDASGLVLETRIAAFAGSPALRVTVTLTSLADRSYSMIARLPILIDWGVTSAEIGVGGAARTLDLTTGGHELRQPDAEHAVIDGTSLPAPGSGWMRGVGETSAITIVRQYFAEEWPQSLGVTTTGLAVGLLAGDPPIPFGVGAAKTFELWVVVDDRAHASDPNALAASLQHPLVAAVDPAWTAAGRALPNAVTSDGPGIRPLLSRVKTGIDRYLARNRAERWDDGEPVDCEARTTEHERIGAFGALNWGDWNFPGYRDRSKGCDAWGNLEYDLPQVLGLTWAGSGWRPAWDAFVAAARHYRDVDILHHAPGHEDLVGINHPHKPRHFAVESKQTVDLGHTWLEGLVTHYRLTGEVRSIEAARGIADVLVRRRYKAGNPRQFGWPMVALAAAYDATRDERYREAALAYADAALRVHEPTPASGDWKMGILADGLAAVHAITGEARLRDWLVRYADALVADPTRFEDPRYALPLGYLARLTGNARYRDDALATVGRMPIGDWGKTLAVSGRTAFRILAPLASSSARPARVAPPPASGGAPRRPSPSPRAPARRTAR